MVSNFINWFIINLINFPLKGRSYAIIGYIQFSDTSIAGSIFLGFSHRFSISTSTSQKNGCLIPARRRAPVRPSAARAAGRRTRGLWLDRPGMNQMLWLPAGGYNRCVCIYIYMYIYIYVHTYYVYYLCIYIYTYATKRDVYVKYQMIHMYCMCIYICKYIILYNNIYIYNHIYVLGWSRWYVTNIYWSTTIIKGVC